MQPDSRYRKVTPTQKVKVPHQGHWLEGELGAWWLDVDEPWRGLVKVQIAGGGSQHWWFDEENIISRGTALPWHGGSSLPEAATPN